MRGASLFMGRPQSYKTAEELQTAIDQFFEDEIKPTLAGLAYYLEIDRQTLYNYADKEMFFDIIKKARERVEAAYEKKLIYDGNPTGVIFALKNMGWRDKTEQDIKYPDGVALNFNTVPSVKPGYETKGDSQQ